MNLTKSESSSNSYKISYLRLLLIVFAIEMVTCCGPGRSGGRQRTQRKLKPLVFKQHVPNVPEKTLTASGPKEGRIGRSDPRFRDLVPNYNPDIVFKDEEGTGEDRLMTQRCKERLNTLAVSVMNLWPGVRLRVTESWDSEGMHHADSLHYEGRAVDVTTSDRDSSKYGMLARLAVEAGFDWVYYESRAHVHCSVKSESKQAAKSMGCFTGDTRVRLASGATVPMRQLRVGERVLSLSADGALEYSEVLLFLHRSPRLRSRFVLLRTASGVNLTVTPSHLVLRWQKPNSTVLHRATPVYARDLRVDDQLLLLTDDGGGSGKRLRVDRVASVEEVFETGVYAPLTVAGTILVNDVVASCYAVIFSQRLAHLSFAPLRWFNAIQLASRRVYAAATTSTSYFLKAPPTTVTATATTIGANDSTTTAATYLPADGVHWYCRFLERVTTFFVPDSWLLEE